MGQTTYCLGLHPRAAVILIAIVDIILCLVSFLLCTVALANLHKISELIERDVSDITVESNLEPAQDGINEFTHVHGEVVLVLLGTLISLFLSLGLLLGVKKDWDCPLKAWLINGCVMILLGLISLPLLAINVNLNYLFFGLLLLFRIYEIWVVFDFLQMSKFSSISLSRSGSEELLHNV